VVELPPSEGTGTTRFAVACPPLRCHGVWLLFDETGDPVFPVAIVAVLPRSIAHRGVATGWATLITDLADGRWAVAVAAPTTATEFRALQALLVTSYTAAFAPHHAGRNVSE
jgi:hypothetical protein